MPKQFQNNLERLTRYFSGKTIVVPKGDNKIVLKTVPDDQVVLNNMWNSKGGFGGMSYGNYQFYKHQMNRLYLFQEYDMMETDSIISRALDIISEEACQPDDFDEIIHIDTDNEKIRVTLEHLFYEIMNVDYTLKGYIRQLIKYGDCFLYLNVQDRIGITDIVPLSTVDVERKEDDNGKVWFNVSSLGTSKIEESRIAHFRDPKNIELLPYGISHLEPVRRFWKQIRLLEDFMMVYYLLRSVNQRVFKIDTGNLAPDKIPAFINEIKQTFKKVPLIDPETGDYNLNYDPITFIEDIVVPVRQGYENTQFDELPASTETNIVDGIEYYRKKMMAGLGIPNFLLNYEEQLNAKATAGQESIHFAKTVAGIQKLVVSELEKIAVVHLILQGYTKEEVLSFSISLTPPSDIRENEKLEKLQTKLDLATSMKDSGLFSFDYIYKELFDFTDAEIKELKDQILQDKLQAKFDEDLIQNTELTADTGDEFSEGGDTLDELPPSGEGSQGGLVEPSESPDTTQSASPEVDAEDVLS